MLGVRRGELGHRTCTQDTGEVGCEQSEVASYIALTITDTLVCSAEHFIRM